MNQTWEEIADKLEDDDDVILPSLERKTLDNEGKFQEISYRKNENGDIIRCFREGKITKKVKKISKDAMERRENWKKFGKDKDKPLGLLIKGITTTRLTEYHFTWEGEKKEMKRQLKQPKIATLRDEANEAINQPQQLSKPLRKSTSYVPPGLRDMGNQKYDYGQDEKFSIKITNLPQVERAQIAQLVDPFYRIELKFERVQRLPNYKIKVFTGRWDNQTSAIVEFDKKDWAEQAIAYFHGKKYGHMILGAEMAKPQTNRN